MRRSMLSHGMTTSESRRHQRRHHQQAEPGGDDDMLAAEPNAVAGRDDHRQAGQHDQRRKPPTGPSPSDGTAIRVPAKAGTHRKEIDVLAGKRVDRRTHDHRRGLAPRPWPAGGQRDQDDEAGMGGEDQRHQAQPGDEIVGHSFRRTQASSIVSSLRSVSEPRDAEHHDEATTAASHGSTGASVARARRLVSVNAPAGQQHQPA